MDFGVNLKCVVFAVVWSSCACERPSGLLSALGKLYIIHLTRCSKHPFAHVLPTTNIIETYTRPIPFIGRNCAADNNSLPNDGQICALTVYLFMCLFVFLSACFVCGPCSNLHRHPRRCRRCSPRAMLSFPAFHSSSILLSAAIASVGKRR